MEWRLPSSEQGTDGSVTVMGLDSMPTLRRDEDTKCGRAVAIVHYYSRLLSIYLSICLSVCVCLSIYLSIYLLFLLLAR